MAFVLAFLAQIASGQGALSFLSLSRDQFRSGEEMLRAFAPVSATTRYSIVKFRVDGKTVALGAIVDTNGLALTKASELKKGKLTCWLASDKEVDAELISTDQEDDVALVRVHSPGLKPIQWESDGVHVGQWAITPGIAKTPHAVGIISALPRRIRPQRALIGIEFDGKSSAPKVDKAGNVHVAIGKVSFAPSQIEENARAVIGAVVKARPHSLKGHFIHSCTLSATMSPPVRVDLKEFAITA